MGSENSIKSFHHRLSQWNPESSALLSLKWMLGS